tara:strand:- start:239 stop:448 length:210 start_codon:yes stop_codon:yes gene_type:complete
MGVKMKQLISVLKAIREELKIANKINSSKLIADTIGIENVKSLTDKQLESITPIATDKIKTIHKNIYDN